MFFAVSVNPLAPIVADRSTPATPANAPVESALTAFAKSFSVVPKTLTVVAPRVEFSAPMLAAPPITNVVVALVPPLFLMTRLPVTVSPARLYAPLPKVTDAPTFEATIAAPCEPSVLTLVMVSVKDEVARRPVLPVAVPCRKMPPVELSRVAVSASVLPQLAGVPPPSVLMAVIRLLSVAAPVKMVLALPPITLAPAPILKVSVTAPLVTTIDPLKTPLVASPAPSSLPPSTSATVPEA